jgi:hypothetical protein
MKFRWNASFSKSWSWQAGATSGGSAQRGVRTSAPVREKLIVRAPFGALRIVGADVAEVAIALRASGRLPDDIAGVDCALNEREGVTELSFERPRGTDAPIVAVDLLVPRAVALEIHCGLGAVDIADICGTCDVHANAGAVMVRLSPDWHGERITIFANLGPATLAVPANLRLRCRASSTIGGAEVAVPSVEEAPAAKVHCNIGPAGIVPREPSA